MAFPATTPAHVATNTHPNWRVLSLAHTKALRRLMRDGRQVASARAALKDAQRNMLAIRHALHAWEAK